VNQADEVLRLAEVRAAALVEGEPDRLRRLLHPEFQWTSHRGERYDRESYVLANTRGLRWLKQRLEDPEVTVVGDTAILLCTANDTVLRDGQEAGFRIPVTQVWVRAHRTWVMLAGHAGPVLD
jgi:hypothetical protein